MAEKTPYYITTAITYTSGKPHIGNTYEIVLTDAIARFKRAQGYDVRFQTGTDEHGQKIEEKAAAAGVSPKAFVDGVAEQIRAIWDMMDISYDKFIRTTDADHERQVQKMFEKMLANGDIYKGTYEGMYCTPCEAFWTPSQLKDGKCPDCHRPVKKAKEEAYFLRLSKYQKQLEDFIESHEDFIYPEARKKEMLNNFLKPGLQDLCVSRSTFSWGIPVKTDPKHVVYVWLDALTNYITGLGYHRKGKSGADYERYWPADVHVIGKDIVRFHTIYWPIFLMALGEPLPKHVYGHPWLLQDGGKMSKSKGNVLYADDLIKVFGVDAVRYYLLAEMPHAQDGSITYETLIERYNTDLANTIGNLVNRTVAMQQKYFDGVVQAPTEPGAFDDDIRALALDTVKQVDRCFNEYKIADSTACVLTLARRLNKYIDETMPWALAKDEEKRARLGTVLYNLLEGIRYLGVLLSPYMPDTADAIFAQLGTDVRDYDSLKAFGGLQAGTKVGTPTPLFSRIDGEKLIAELLEQQKKEQEAEKKAAEAAAGLAPIHIEDFMKTELRVAEVKACEPVKRSKKLLKLTLDDGSGAERTVASGIAPWYKPEDLIGKKVVLVANLKPAKLCGVESCGMILAADCAEDNVQVVFVDSSMPNGARIR